MQCIARMERKYVYWHTGPAFLFGVGAVSFAVVSGTLLFVAIGSTLFVATGRALFGLLLAFFIAGALLPWSFGLDRRRRLARRARWSRAGQG